ncbi:MAG: hypothetical protein FJ253_05090 [Phycisphaerae bacterium]|nr:hypothetical protein [Phycisphaerae bacterium]
MRKHSIAVENARITRITRITRCASIVAALGVASIASAGLPPLEQLCSVEYAGPVNLDDVATIVRTAPDGTIVIAGESTQSGSDRDIMVAKFTVGGALLWIRTWDSPSGGNDYTGGMAIADDGSICVAGYFYGGTPSTTMVVVRYDADGDLLWATPYAIGNASDWHNQFYSVAVDSIGDVYACGSAGQWSGGGNAAIVKFDGVTGAYLWQSTFNGPANLHDQGNFVVVGSDDSVAMVGSVKMNASATGVGIWKLFSNGGTAWSSYFNYSAATWSETAAAAALGPDDKIVFAGWVTSPQGSEQPIVVRYHWQGGQDTTTLLQTSGQNRFNSVVVDDAGNTYVTGAISAVTGLDIITLKVHTSPGGMLWQRTFTEQIIAPDSGLSVDVDKYGRVVVAGSSWHLTQGQGGPQTVSGIRLLGYDPYDGASRFESFVTAPSGGWMAKACALPAGGVIVCGTTYPNLQMDAWFGAWAESVDCDHNGVIDVIELMDGSLTDANEDGVPDECAAFGDLDGNGIVDGEDLGALLGSWGACSGCPADLNGDGVVDGDDLGTLLGNWG